MKFILDSAKSWEVPMARARRKSPGSDLGFAALRLCQSSGLGITIAAAYSFAAWIGGRSEPGLAWDRLLDEAILREEGLSIAEALRRLSQYPFVACQMFLFPLAARVQSSIGQTYLMVPFPALSDRAPIAADQAGAAFDDELARNLSSVRSDDQAFRTTLALHAVQFLRDPDARAGNLPAPDLEGSILFLAAAGLGLRDTSRLETRPLPEISTIRVSHRFQSDGIAGVRHASPSEDPSSMLPSQMMYPAAILTERIANEGFVAFDRPPSLPQVHRFAFVALPIGIDDGDTLSLCRAAFWLAARDVEATLAGSAASLEFAWMPRGRGARPNQTQRHAPPR